MDAMNSDQLTPLQGDEQAAMLLDRSAVIRVVSALREYRKLVETMCGRYEMHSARADAESEVPRIEGTAGD
jgi:hypothetical protein